jgi:hypothetical protein
LSEGCVCAAFSSTSAVYIYAIVSDDIGLPSDLVLVLALVNAGMVGNQASADEIANLKLHVTTLKCVNDAVIQFHILIYSLSMMQLLLYHHP